MPWPSSWIRPRPGLISDGRYALAKTTARIDHHLFTGQIAQLEAIDTGSESCCGLIVRLAMEHGLRLTPVAAQSLFIGMVTDSGRFRYDATSARTFRAGGLAAGAAAPGCERNISQPVCQRF